jgi:hypothetical protein
MASLVEQCYISPGFARFWLRRSSSSVRSLC